jgi:hypothetical protein
VYTTWEYTPWVAYSLLMYGVQLGPSWHTHTTLETAKIRWKNNDITMLKSRRYDDEKSKVRWWKVIITKRNYDGKTRNHIEFSYFRLCNFVVSSVVCVCHDGPNWTVCVCVCVCVCVRACVRVCASEWVSQMALTGHCINESNRCGKFQTLL